jgi:hypothetical protein
MSVSSSGFPDTASAGEAVQTTVARRAGTRGPTMPVRSTAASSAPTAWTHPAPLEWATAAQANMATMLPDTGASQATGCTWRRSRCPPRTRRATRPRYGEPQRQRCSRHHRHHADERAGEDHPGPEDGPGQHHAAHAGHQADQCGVGGAPAGPPSAG